MTFVAEDWISIYDNMHSNIYELVTSKFEYMNWRIVIKKVEVDWNDKQIRVL